MSDFITCTLKEILFSKVNWYVNWLIQLEVKFCRDHWKIFSIKIQIYSELKGSDWLIEPILSLLKQILKNENFVKIMVKDFLHQKYGLSKI